MVSSDHTHHDEHHDLEVYSKTILGFWFFLLTDFVLFGVLFATYIVLQDQTFGGEGAQQLFRMPLVLIQTCLLLASTYFMTLASSYIHQKRKKLSLGMMALAFLLGLAFIVMLFDDFEVLIKTGNSWSRSGFLSAYFTLTGTLALHMILALAWVFVVGVPICFDKISLVHIKRVSCLKMFWQFLNLIWFFIFCIVYLIGVN